MVMNAGEDRGDEEHRADAAHRCAARPGATGSPAISAGGGGVSPLDDRVAASADPDLSLPPAQIVGAQCPKALERLELLDDTVFEAIAGRPGALDELRRLWPAVLTEVGPELVEESREQYLRHALAVWRQCVEGDQIHNPSLALATMEVICLLFADK